MSFLSGRTSLTTVNTGDIADDAVTLAKLAAGTANYTILYDGSGNPAEAASISVAQGGTGAATHTANNVLIGNGTSAISSVAPSTSGNILTSNGSAWTSAAAAGGGPSQASQAAIEAETNEDTYIPPDLLRYGPGVAKGWVDYNQSGNTVDASYNVSSVTDSATGSFIVNWNTDFSTANYSCVSQTGAETYYGTYSKSSNITAKTTGTTTIQTKAATQPLDSAMNQVVAFGDQ